MSVLPRPMEERPPATGDGGARTDAGELELRQQIEELRRENQHLRREFARILSAKALQVPGTGPDLPLPLESALCTGCDSNGTTQIEYQALFSALASVFPIGVFRTDPAGVLTHVDQTLCHLFELDVDAFPNFGWLERVHPDDLERVQQQWVQGIRRGLAMGMEFRLIKPDGRENHLLVRNAPVHDAQGRLQSHLGFVQDITHLRALEADARLKDELNRHIIASSPDCTKVLDLQGQVLQMTAQGCRLVEVDDFEQVRGSDWTQWWPDEGHELAANSIRAARAGESSRFIAFGPTFKGTPKWWDTMISPIRDAQGQPVMLLAVSRDITEHQNQQASIRRLNAELEQRVRERTEELANINERLTIALRDANALYNQAPCGYHSLDADGVFQLINQTQLDWLGLSREAVVGRLRFQDVFIPDNAGELQQRFETLKQTGSMEPIEVSIRRADGRMARVLASSVGVFDERGHFLRSNSTLIDITERKHAEDQLRLANEQLQQALEQSRALYDKAPCGYHSLNADGTYIAINDTELQWLGYRRDEVLGRKTFRDFILPERSGLLAERMQRLVRDGSLEGAEYELRRRDGTLIHALLTSNAVYDASGRFLHSNTTVVDISQRKAAEAALQENQRFMQTITDHVPGLIAYLDAMLRFRFANAEHQRVYGMDPQKIIGLHISECVAPDVWADIGPRMQAALRGQPQHFEAWRRTVDGTPLFISANYLPDIHDGLVQGVFVQIIDITERKRIEERVAHLNDELEQRIRERSAELLESEQRFRLMVDNLREYCIFFMDAQGYITDWTDSAQRMEGHSPTEMLGRHYSILFDDSEKGHALASANQMLRLAASRGQHELQSWHARKDGSHYWSHSLLIALRDDSGELQGFAKINRDMTDAKRLDDLMRNINDELENRVAERTEQLLAANKDLESFSYSVSHDLRSPLRHISSFVSLLEEHLQGQVDDTAQKYLGTISNSARHMSQLIDGLLAFSRLGRAAVNLTPVDLTLLVDAVVAQIAHDTEGRVVDWVIAPDLPVIQGDALLLREVWANLLGNAYKYSRPRERARIEVGWSVDPATGYTFFVRDNGVGFDTKYSQKLFGVFQRLHRASEFEGTGIGLALTRRIIERHGGSIWAESRVGEGSVFYFSLPLEGLQNSDPGRDSHFSPLEP